MGVIVKETIETPYGTSVTDPFASFADNRLRVEKTRILDINGGGEIKYQIMCELSFWANLDCRQNGKSCIKK